jgi:hypothetical protein
MSAARTVETCSGRGTEKAKIDRDDEQISTDHLVSRCGSVGRSGIRRIEHIDIRSLSEGQIDGSCLLRGDA